MVIQPRDLTQEELNKIAEFYVEDNGGVTKDFTIDEALKELTEETSLLKAFDLNDKGVLVSRTWFNMNSDGSFEKIYEEYHIYNDIVEVVTEYDVL
jgi:hypothetical protein